MTRRSLFSALALVVGFASLWTLTEDLGRALILAGLIFSAVGLFVIVAALMGPGVPDEG